MGRKINFSAAKELSDEELLQRAAQDVAEHIAKRKKGKKSATKKGGKLKLSKELAEELDKLSDLSLDKVETNLDLLKEIRRILIATLNTSRGAVIANPRPGSIYALTRLSNDIMNITRAIEDSIDYSELSVTVFEEVVKPFIDRTLLDLGSHIKDALEKYAGDDPKKYKRMEKVMTEAYRKYGASLETKIPGMQSRLRKTILNHTK